MTKTCTPTLAAVGSLCLLLGNACGLELPIERKTSPRCDIPVVDEGSYSGRPTQPQPQPQPPAAPQPAAPTQAAPSGSGASIGTAQQRQTVRTYIQRLMDETRIVPDTAAKRGGPRGSAGSFAKLSPEQVDQFVSAVIKGAELFLPKSLTDEQRWALVCAEISIESAFTPGTSGDNPGNIPGGDHYISVGPLQLTLNQNPNGKGMWDDIFRQYANLPGLTHYDGSPWDTKSTSNDALKTDIYDGVVAALWCITEQGRRGGPDWFGGPDGPLPKTMHTAYLAWVIGVPALKSGGDLDGQRDMYLASISTDLKLLGFDPALIETAF